MRALFLTLLILILIFNISYAFNVPYQFLTDYNHYQFIVKVVNTTPQNKYYLCEIDSLRCSEIKNENHKLNLFNTFYSPDKNKAIFQVRNSGSYFTFLNIWPFTIKVLPIKEKISDVVFDNYKLAVFTSKKLFIISIVDESILQTINLPQKSSKFRISDDFKQLIYFRNDKNNKISLYLLNIDDQSEKLLTEINNHRNSIGYVEFVNDQIFFTLNNNFTEVYIYDLRFNKLEKLYDENFLIDDVIKIKNKIYFTANKDNPLIWSLYEFDPQTKITTKIYEGIAYEFKLTQMRDYLVFKSTGELPPQITFYDLKNKTFKNLNLDLKTQKIKTGDIVNVENIYSVLLKPDNFDSQNEYDLIVWLHGGPMRQTSVGHHPYFAYGVYDYLLENLRKNNYLIIKIDYPGSWGYGKEYQNSLKNNIGKLDAEAVLKVVNYLKNNFKIKNIHLIGNSYGGYLSLKTLYEHPEIFTSAVSINGVSDWWTLIKKIPSSIFTEYFNGSPNRNNKNLYDQASIFLKPEKLKDKKIILIYGTNDETIPNEQTLLFYEKYKDIADIQLLELDDGHSITKKENLEKILNLLLRALK